MRRIEADESLHRTQILQVGSGLLPQARAQDLIRSWQRAAAGPRQPAKRAPLTEAQWRGRLAAAGIGVIVEPAPAPTPEPDT